jgi:hypothetical protein
MKIDWNYLNEKVKEFSDELSIMTRERDKLSRHYNLMMKEKSFLKSEYNSVLKLAEQKKNILFDFHKKVNERKKEWFSIGGTDDDFCLDVEGYSLQLQFKNLIKEDVDFIKDEPKNQKEKYLKISNTCDKLLEMIKLYDDKIKLLNQELSFLHLHEEIKDCSYNKNDGSLIVEIFVFQLSVKRKKTYLNHKKYYTKIDDVWYRTYDNLKKKKVLSSEHTDKLIKSLNKYFKDTKDVT